MKNQIGCIKNRVDRSLNCLRLFKGNLFKRKFILFNTPEHGNLGDHAIAIAERQFLKKYFPDIPVIEIPGEWLKRDFFIFRRIIGEKDMLLITGGGFMGDLWQREENLIRDILTYYPDHKLFFFPQTVYFTNTEKGRKELEKSQGIYQGHHKTSMCLREQESYQLIINNFTRIKNIQLYPDMVLGLRIQPLEMPNREGVLLCFREDKERLISEHKKSMISDYIKQCGKQCRDTTTVEKLAISCNQREEAVYKKLEEFRNSELVITDRLHAMLFAAITGTPCIAFDNCSRKVSGVYKWIRELPYIKIADEKDDIYVLINKMGSLSVCRNEIPDFKGFFGDMAAKMANFYKLDS